MKSAYEVLGVAQDAPEAQIKAAYRKLALKFHPDRNAGSAAASKRFKEINEAYDALKTPAKRAQYDKLGATSGAARDPFEDFFASEAAKAGQAKGRDITLIYGASLRQLAEGASVELVITTKVECALCAGRGKLKAATSARCTECGGSGVTRRKQGFVVFERTCSTCAGSGVASAEACTRCSAEGRVAGVRKAKLAVSAGAEDGSVTKLAGLGEAGAKSAPAGDLYVKLVSMPHAFYARRGADLLCSLAVSMQTAIMGGRVDVRTPAGQWLTVSVPPLDYSDAQLVLRRRGLPTPAGDVGSLHMKLAVNISRLKPQPKFSSQLLASLYKLNLALRHLL
ncbi:putative chaperone protein DnaJ [Candidatus Hodgkinia cicadicola Dsem]|nr:putative chaperone protein DnaJ [Candidatus Hodgkinia cicadicola Dsem]